jgi:putative ABC transport system permease protein
MTILRKATHRARTLAGRGRFENDLDDEMRFHLEMEAARHVERGLSPEEARALARREFGPVDRFKDEVRDARGVTWLDDVRRDVRFGLRSLRRSPGFAAVAVLCLGLGIGANAAIFSVLNAVLLRPLPYAEPDRLVRAYETFGPTHGRGSVAYANFHDWKEQGTDFEHLTAWVAASLNLQGNAEPERIKVVAATAEVFPLLGVRPLLGRAFGDFGGQTGTGHGEVIVLGEKLWRRRFGGDRSVVGRTIRLDGEPYTVLGVMPAAFDFPPNAAADAWGLFDPSPGVRKDRGGHFLGVIGRLKPGVREAQAQAQLRQVADRLARAYPKEQAGRGADVVPLRETVVGQSRPALLILLGAVALVLLIACANVANLLLARAAVRRREVAVRLSLGASRARLIRQFLVESLVLAAAGALLGALLARWGLSALGPLARGALPIAGGIPLDGRVFGFLLLVSALSGLLFGLVPALQASREDLRDTLSDAGAKATAGGRQQLFRSALVVAEIALSLVLLAGAGLLLRGFLRLSGTPSGLVADHVLTAHVAIPDAKIKGATPRLLQPMLDRVRHLPGVRSAGLITMLPIQDAWTNGSYAVVGRPAPPPGQEPLAEERAVSPGLFATLGIPILRGRDFTDRDGGPGVRLAIVNEALARQQFPGENPVGRQLQVLETGPPHTIIGVIGNVRQAGLDQAPLPEIYASYVQEGAEGWFGDAVLVVRTAVPPASVAAAVRGAVRGVDPSLPLFKVETMEEVIAKSLAGRRLNLWLLGIFAGIALVLSAAGLYGVISYLVAQRTREIGVRIALGAQTRDVIGLVMRQGTRLTAVGIGLGLLAALAFTRVLEGLLYGVSARDPFTFSAVAALLAAIALLATWLPARRAARVDPILAIRNE